jgi:conjugative transfer signal peptidase TraF
MSAKLYSTAENPAGSLKQRVHLQQLEGARRAGQALGAIVIAAVLLIGLGDAFGILISNTDSAAPAGVYRISGYEIARGDLVAACLPIGVAREGLARGYLRTGGCPGNAEPVDKMVGALPGAIVDIEPGWVAVNGRRFGDSATASHDSAGRRLAHVAWGKRTVAANQIWLFGFNDPRSWDSRYFGPIPLSNIRGDLKPVITW